MDLAGTGKFVKVVKWPLWGASGAVTLYYVVKTILLLTRGTI